MTHFPIDSLADLGARINEAHHLTIQHAGKAIEQAPACRFSTPPVRVDLSREGLGGSSRTESLLVVSSHLAGHKSSIRRA
jgi:hypothetical protein